MRASFYQAMVFAILATGCAQEGGIREADAPAVRAEGTEVRLVPIERPDAPVGAHLALELMPDHARNKVRVEWDAAGFEGGTSSAQMEPERVLHVLNGAPPMQLTGTERLMPARPGRNVLFSCVRSAEGPVFTEPGTFVLTEFTMRGADALGELDLATTPCLFMLSPPGTGTVNPPPLLDILAVNCTLAPNAYLVRATIDGKVFMIDSARPFKIEGLARGNHSVQLELLQPDGLAVPGPYTATGVRSFTF